MVSLVEVATAVFQDLAVFLELVGGLAYLDSAVILVFPGVVDTQGSAVCLVGQGFQDLAEIPDLVDGQV